MDALLLTGAKSRSAQLHGAAATAATAAARREADFLRAKPRHRRRGVRGEEEVGGAKGTRLDTQINLRRCV